MTPQPRMWVIDSSSIIRIKQLATSQAHERALFGHMAQMVERGELTFPKQVISEVEDWTPPDGAAKWVKNNGPRRQFRDVPDDHLRVVMAEAPDVVDPNKTKDDADPYVIAMARHLRQSGYDVCIVTDDVRQQPRRISMAEACSRPGLQLSYCQTVDFLAQIWPPVAIPSKQPVSIKATPAQPISS